MYPQPTPAGRARLSAQLQDRQRVHWPRGLASRRWRDGRPASDPHIADRYAAPPGECTPSTPAIRGPRAPSTGDRFASYCSRGSSSASTTSRSHLSTRSIARPRTGVRFVGWVSLPSRAPGYLRSKTRGVPRCLAASTNRVLHAGRLRPERVARELGEGRQKLDRGEASRQPERLR